MKWLGVLLAAYGGGAVLLTTALLIARGEVSDPDGPFIIILVSLMCVVIASIGVAMVRSAARLERSQRALDGQCAGCAYDLHGHPTRATCPECGMARSGFGRDR